MAKILKLFQIIFNFFQKSLILLAFYFQFGHIVATILYFKGIMFKNLKKLDKKTRARLRELARVESVYNLTGTPSTYRGFSIHSGMSTRSSSINKKNAYELSLANFVDTGRSQKIYS